MEAFLRARAALSEFPNSQPVPILIGPLTFVAVSSVRRRGGAARPLEGGGCCAPHAAAADASVDTSLVARLVPAYLRLLRSLRAAGAAQVQLHEPALALDGARVAAFRAAAQAAYAAFAADSSSPEINLVIPYDDVDESAYPWVVSLPVSCVTLDFCGVPGSSAPPKTLELLRAHGFPHAVRRLGAGVVDGRSVWGENACAPGCGAVDILAALVGPCGIPKEAIVVAPSCSLHHVPYDVDSERRHLDDSLVNKLSFAVQKAAEVACAASRLAAGDLPRPAGAAAAARKPPAVDAAMLTRASPFASRRPTQIFGDPIKYPFPTSTIGSFPQTTAVRRLRAKFTSGAINREAYEAGSALRKRFSTSKRDLEKHLTFHLCPQLMQRLRTPSACRRGWAWTCWSTARRSAPTWRATLQSYHEPLYEPFFPG